MTTNCDKNTTAKCDCPVNGQLNRNGTFFRKSDSKTIRRWRCRLCNKSVSDATGTPCFRQHKRRVNEPLRKMLCSGVSQRRAAKILNIHLVTVARKLKFLAKQARIKQAKYKERYNEMPLHFIQFDEMETFEHTKLKPLSIAVIVSEKRRKILGLRVSEMPAKGPLALSARTKYGFRADKRKEGFIELFTHTKKLIHKNAELKSDQKPQYPFWLRQINTDWIHTTTKGRRGCIVGQGELKKIGFDPIFSLNHTCAMLRANINRLFRQTWCTTKKKERLQDHLDLYMDFHNRELTSDKPE